jgi:cytochrome c
MRRTHAVVILVGLLCLGTVGATLGAGQGRTVWDGIYTDEQADRGEPLYQDACASCHAQDLSGGQMVPELLGGEFVWNWSGLTIGQLFERLRISMPQEDPASVSRQEKADILAFILRANEFPAGEKELASRAEMLDQFMFEALKP